MKLTIDQISNHFREAIALNGMLRRLGLDADCIYAHQDPNGNFGLIVRLPPRPDLFFLCGIRQEDAKTTMREWQALVRAVSEHRVSEADLQRIYYESKALKNGITVVKTLNDYNVPFPKLGLSSTEKYAGQA
jgi:hypothetical protein